MTPYDMPEPRDEPEPVTLPEDKRRLNDEQYEER